VLDLTKLCEVVRYEGGLNRRLFLAYSASLSAIPLLGQQAGAKPHRPKLPMSPFQLGVASGDPTPDGVVLWTRLAPHPLEADGGMAPHNVEVSWEVAADDSMRRIVRQGTTTAVPELAHSVHAEVGGLAPDRWYWYRFRVGDAESAIGRTRTMPALDASPGELNFAFASCQHFESGLYTAYEHMAQEELDLVFHLGDYIYEGAAKEDQVRKHIGKGCESLDDYRRRHSQYKTDPLLQAMHARCPWMVTWDDHEVNNDYANDRSQNKEVDAVKFLARRANAYQAYYEMMPLRRTSLPRGPKMQLFRSLPFGQLANFLVLDTRQYRSLQPNDDKPCDINDACTSSKNTMLGKRQMAWVQDSLTRSPAAWNVFAQQVMMAEVDGKAGPERLFGMDHWCGYVAERNKLMQFVHDHRVSNPIVLTGDIHSNWVNDLRLDDLQPETPIAATEFVGTSISSSGDGERDRGREARLKAENPGVRFYNRERGYVRCKVTPKQWQTDYRTVPYITKPGAPVDTRASFVVESGRAGAERA